MFMDLYEGKKLSFDLTCENQKPKFNNKNFCVDSRLEFDRVIGF